MNVMITDIPAPPKRRRANAIWTQEMIDLLRKLRSEGCAFLACAAQINFTCGTRFTRNACIGKAGREKIPGPGPATRNHNKPPTRARHELPRRGPPMPRPHPAFRPGRTPKERPIPAEANPVALLNLAPHHCRWIIGNEGKGAQTMFCGAQKREEGGPYCTDHSAAAYSKRAKRPPVRSMYAIRTGIFA